MGRIALERNSELINFQNGASLGFSIQQFAFASGDNRTDRDTRYKEIVDNLRNGTYKAVSYEDNFVGTVVGVTFPFSDYYKMHIIFSDGRTSNHAVSTEYTDTKKSKKKEHNLFKVHAIIDNNTKYYVSINYD